MNSWRCYFHKLNSYIKPELHDHNVTSIAINAHTSMRVVRNAWPPDFTCLVDKAVSPSVACTNHISLCIYKTILPCTN